ncbi:MAG: hypothetical protein KC636_15380, partial [Myxococcales bacterium]|nr:hypothetical protein [Myxococcales bacterium]
ALRAAWDALLDPRRSLLVVHAGHGSKREEASAELGALAAAWRRGDEPTATEDAHARLAIGPASGSGGGFLLGEQRAPLHVLESDASGAPVLIFGRVIPTTSPRDRSLARLAQRLLQERLDARLAIVGDTAQLIVVLPLRGNPRRLSSGALELLGLEGDDDERGDAPAGGAIGQQLERFQKIIRARPPPQRMFQTAELWLGARMVEASLRGEDWTALWTLAIDLSREDQEIAGALARDARGMLDATPEQLLAWQKRWLDPGAGERGWTWVAAGDPKRLAPFLDALGDVERVQVTTR